MVSLPVIWVHVGQPPLIIMTLAAQPLKNIWVAAGEGDLQRVQVNSCLHENNTFMNDVHQVGARRK